MKFIWLFLLPLIVKSQTIIELKNGKDIPPLTLSYKFPAYIDSLLATSADRPPYQYAGTLFSMIGLAHETFDNFYGIYNSRPPLDDSTFNEFTQRYQPTNAVNYIVEKSKNQQIVIINEAHHKGKHRAFTASLLQELYDQGFKHLGLEALMRFEGKTDSLINERGYPLQSSGFYISEPNFANLIREALAIGYNLFAYETTLKGSAKEREMNQAKNIEAYRVKHPNAKILIHCGYEHAKEGLLSHSWEKAMAGRLTEYTGINPLTINQTKFDNRWDSSYLHPLSQRIEIEEPTVYITKDSVSYLGENDSSGFDIYVFHEQEQLINGRPKWKIDSNHLIYKFNIDSIPFEDPFLLMAFKTNEGLENTIAEDLLYVDPLAADLKSSVALILKKGLYEIVAQTQDGRTIQFSVKLE